MIDIKDLCKYYLVGDERVKALDQATLHIYPHEFVSIIGPSGSGKSTLMNIIGCLDVADAGSYYLDNLPIEAYSENELAQIRNQKISQCGRSPTSGFTYSMNALVTSCPFLAIYLSGTERVNFAAAWAGSAVNSGLYVLPLARPIPIVPFTGTSSIPFAARSAAWTAA